MKRSLEEKPDLVLLAPDGAIHSAAKNRCLFRAGRCLPDESVEQAQVAAAQVAGLEGVLRLEVLGSEAVAVENEGDQGEWNTVQVLERGEDAILGPGSRFYVLGAMKETVIEVKITTSTVAPGARDQTHQSSKRRTGDSSTSEPQCKFSNESIAGCGDAMGSGGNQQTPALKNAPFSLMWVRSLGEDSNYNKGALGVRLRDLVSGTIHTAFVSNYMIDFPWLLSSCPGLHQAQNLIIVHGEQGSRSSSIRASVTSMGLKSAVVHAPPLPVMYGTHHSKAFVLGYNKGVRVIIHTANLIYADCNNKTQGIWWQDFPEKGTNGSRSDFEEVLLSYLAKLKMPKEAHARMKSMVSSHDFSGARVKLVTSVPGYHQAADLRKYGHMRVRDILQHEKFDDKFNGSPVVSQFSSIGSLDEKWLTMEFMGSLGQGESSKGGQLHPPCKGPLGAKLVWPCVSEVRDSIEGWAAGYSIPGPSKNVLKPFLRAYYNRYNGESAGRQYVMPHIKTYARYQGTDLAWVLLASHNLSKAAWGTLQKKETQLMVRSYEMGVLFVPSAEQAFRNSRYYGFSCTDESHMDSSLSSASQLIPSGGRALTNGTNTGKYKCFGSASADEHSTSKSDEEVVFPLPYPLPSQAYSKEDIPWMVDCPQEGLDSLGRLWGSPVAFYGKKDDVT